MELEGVSEFKRMQSTKKIGYTYFRFEKNTHKELVGRPVAAFNIDGAYLLIPFSKSKSKTRILSEQMINDRLGEVIRTIRDEIEGKAACEKQTGNEKDAFENLKCCYGDSNPSRRSESPS